MGQGISLESERKNPWFWPWFNILLHIQSIVGVTISGQCLEYLGYITLPNISKQLKLALKVSAGKKIS